MVPASRFYAKPHCEGIPLRVEPRLASWTAANHPDQVRLNAYLADMDDLLQPLIAATPDPLTLRLDVALPRHIELLSQRDLDNYLFPLATRLSRTSGRRFASLWASKQHAEFSSACVAQAHPVESPLMADRMCSLRTTASSETVEYKQEIHDQLDGSAILPDGAVILQIGFATGRSRNCMNLWKPTIDALGVLLGSSAPGRQWHPKDGCVVELGLHCHIEPGLRNDVLITIAASAPPMVVG